MKNVFILLFSLIVGSMYGLDMSVNYSRFFSEENSYVEFNFYVIGQSIHSTNAEINPSVQMTMIIKHGEKIIFADKFNVLGFKQGSNFSAIKRYALLPGTYLCTLEVVDNSDVDNKFTWDDLVTIETPKSSFYLSDIQLLSSIKKADQINDAVKNGYELESLPFLFSKSAMGQIYYYVEAYNSPELGAQYELKIDIVEHYKNRPDKLIQSTTKKRKAKLNDIIVGHIKLIDLPSGNIKVKMYAMNNGQASSISEREFQNSNTVLQITNSTMVTESESDFLFLNSLSKEELIYALKSLVPRIASTDLEAVNMAIQSQNIKKIKYLLKYHWSNFGGPNYQNDYLEYMMVAKAVDNKYDSGYGEGFETDRGYYYLKYGRPDNIVSQKNDINAPPYEIWTYNSIPELQQTNVHFVFYNPTLSPGNYELLHSTAKGEYNNPRWRVELTNDGSTKGDVNRVDGTDVEDGFGQNSGRYYDDN